MYFVLIVQLTKKCVKTLFNINNQFTALIHITNSLHNLATFYFCKISNIKSTIKKTCMIKNYKQSKSKTEEICKSVHCLHILGNVIIVKLVCHCFTKIQN